MKSAIARTKDLLKKKPLAVSLAAAILAMVFSAGYIRQKEAEVLKISEPVPVVIAGADIQAGDILHEGILEKVSIPRRFAEPGHAGKIEEAAGMVAMVPIKRGTQITLSLSRAPSAVGGLSGIIPAGLRAVAVGVDDVTGVAQLVRPYDSVDVIATMDTGTEAGKRRISFTAVENVTVLAIGKKVAESPPEAGAKKERSGMFTHAPTADPSMRQMTVTLAVAPAEAQALAFVSQSGVASLALRPFGDDGTGERTPPTSAETFAIGFGNIVPMGGRFREFKGR